MARRADRPTPPRPASLGSRLSLRPSSQDDAYEPHRPTLVHGDELGDWLMLVCATALAAFFLHAWSTAGEPHVAVEPAAHVETAAAAPGQD